MASASTNKRVYGQQMMTFGQEDSYEETCENCGAIHKVLAIRLPVAEEHELRCNWCDAIFVSDRSSWSPTCSIKAPGDSRKMKSKKGG